MEQPSIEIASAPPERSAPIERRSIQARCRLAFSAACVGLLYAVFHGALRWWRADGPILISSGTLLAIVSAAALAISWYLARKDARQASPLGSFAIEQLVDPAILAVAIPIIFFSDWLTFSYALYQGPSIRGEIFALTLLSLAVISVFGSPWPLVVGWAALTPPLLLGNFLGGASGRLLFSDDHAAMMYRLALLTENFPRIPCYDVMWNAGTDARDFFATGVLNFYLMIAPFVDSANIFSRYTVLVGLLLFGALPLSVYLSARLLSLSMRAAAVSSLLAVASTLTWYRWGLKYGAIGFLTSTVLLPISTALVLRLLDREKEPSARLCAATVVAVTLTVLWSMMGVVLLPLILLAALQAPRLLRNRRVLVSLLLLLAINLPWMALFVRVSQVSRFLTLNAPGYEQQARDAEQRAEQPEAEEKAVLLERNAIRGGHDTFSMQSVQKSLRTAGTSVNPLLLFFGLPGVLLLGRGAARQGFLAMSAWLLFLGVVLAPAKPQLELDRMLVILFILLAIPAGRALELFFDRSFRNGARVRASAFLLAGITGGFLLVGTGAAGAAARNRTLEQFWFASGEVQSLADSITKFSGDGRTLFTGFVLHELSGGHLAPLAHMVRKPLLASSPVHNRWWYTDVIPQEYRERGESGINRYLELMNVTAVIAHEPVWRKYFEQRPQQYALRWKGRKFRLYERLTPSTGYFLQGSGTVSSQTTGGLTIVPATEDVVLKFNYLPFLEVNGCKKIEPFEESSSVRLVKLAGCTPGVSATVRSVSPVERLVGTW